MAKVMAPAPPAGYVRRASLLHRVDTVLDRRLTVLQAPGGFGKTTVLADVSHRKKKQGVIAAWLSLDRDDTADVFGHYLARAFEHAGLNLSTIDDDDAWSSSPFKQQSGNAGPCDRACTRTRACSCWTRWSCCRPAPSSRSICS